MSRVSTLRTRLSGRSLLLIGLTAVLVALLAAGGVRYAVRERSSVASPADSCRENDDLAWEPSGEKFAAGFEQHPFVGNGYLGLRVPPAGMGYQATGEASGWPLRTPRYDGAHVAGLFGREPGVGDGREAAVAIPTWSTLTVGVGDESYSPATPPGRISRFRQSVELRCGLVRTASIWTTGDGRSTELNYSVLADRTDQHVGVVHLTVVPRWSGKLTVTDLLDGAGARRIVPAGGGAHKDATMDVAFRTMATDVTGAVASTLRLGHTVPATSVRKQTPTDGLTARQEVSFQVERGKSYELDKFVGVDTTLTSADPEKSALDAAGRAAARGWSALFAAHAEAWQALWRADIEIPGRRELQRWVREQLYLLYSATNARQDNSISPTGLSSDNYAGQIFWDAETWMYPGLLQLAPELAASVVNYRHKTLPGAQANARKQGLPGALYPWTSASVGDLEECHSWQPPHCLTQIHLQGDISLAAWQYYLATKDTDYLRARSWPIMKAVAEFWAGRVTDNHDGTYSIRNVAGPDEYSNGVDDGVYTNAVAALALRNAVRAAQVLGEPSVPEWSAIADRLRIPFDRDRQIFLQYQGYRGTKIKQADTALLLYPLEWPMSNDVAVKTLDYYVEHTDPDGPAMTDSVHAIDAAEIGEPGCSSYTYLERAVRPFVREPFGQLSETRGDKVAEHKASPGTPAFNFDTAAGGLIQSFTNGLAGLRYRENAIRLNPVLPPQLTDGIVIHGLHWQGRVFDVQVGPQQSTVTVSTGEPLPVESATGTQLASVGHPLVLKTRRPDLLPTDNAARCRTASATSAQAGRYADAAVDGSTTTAWVPDADQAAMTVDLGASGPIARIAPHWTDAQPASFGFDVSDDNRRWSPVSPDTASGALPATAAGRYVRVHVSDARPESRPGLRELEIVRPPR